MFENKKIKRIIFTIVPIFILLMPALAKACGGINVILSDNPSKIAVKKEITKEGILYFGPSGELILNKSIAKVSPEQAYAIVNKFVSMNIPSLVNRFRFRKLEYVHGRVIYQFESLDRLKGYNGKYHLGPVNFIVDHLILDVDARTGELFLANGCGAAPGQLLARYNLSELKPAKIQQISFISDNTNFIARKTDHSPRIDGIISPEEWANTGHRYFYIGEYSPHKPSQPHKKPFYHVEVWSQIDDKYIYFAVKTDTPYWIALMFKEDSNLGMLWSYKDAKLLKSNGEISDRYFTQRKDKTFFLEKDEKNDIVAAATRQDNLYTYEFAFPLKTYDKQDITFQEGKAYNMLVLVGNTLEHYGIFTLDKAHKNHAHSKNNKEHADVWASNETILRIGTPAQYDIFGRLVNTALNNYTSGFDPERNDTHIHYAAHTIQDIKNKMTLSAYMNFFTVIIGLIGIAFMFVKTNGTIRHKKELDLFNYSLPRKIFSSKYYRATFIVPVLLVFTAMVLAGFLDVQDGRQNITTVYTWTLWWTLIIFTFILFGRLWCMMCPFAALADLAQKLFSMNKRFPSFLRNMALQIIGFVLLTFAYAYFSLYQKPMATSLLILGILAVAVLSSIIYEKRTFCRYICPIGAVIGLYSTVAPFKLMPVINRRCIAHRTKTCSNKCPMLEDPYRLDSNLYCNYCMKCLSSCPSGNLSLKFQGFGKDIINGIRRSSVEAIASLVLFGIVLFETLAMTSAFSSLKSFISNLTSIKSNGLLFTVSYVLTIITPALLFTLASFVLSKWYSTSRCSPTKILSTYAFVFIPLGIGLHLAHNLNHLFIEAPVAVPATLRLLQKVGLFESVFLNWNPKAWLGAGWIFLLQMLTVASGFIFTVYMMLRRMDTEQLSRKDRFKTFIVLAVYATVMISITFYLMGLPMNSRHVH